MNISSNYATQYSYLKGQQSQRLDSTNQVNFKSSKTKQYIQGIAFVAGLAGATIAPFIGVNSYYNNKRFQEELTNYQVLSERQLEYAFSSPESQDGNVVNYYEQQEIFDIIKEKNDIIGEYKGEKRYYLEDYHKDLINVFSEVDNEHGVLNHTKREVIKHLLTEATKQDGDYYTLKYDRDTRSKLLKAYAPYFFNKNGSINQGYVEDFDNIFESRDRIINKFPKNLKSDLTRYHRDTAEKTFSPRTFTSGPKDYYEREYLNDMLERMGKTLETQ